MNIEREKKVSFLKKGKCKIYFNFEKNTVTKIFSIRQQNEKKTGTGKHPFLRELDCLKVLQKYKYFPKLISYDEKNLSITTKHCGEKINKPRPDLLNQIEHILFILNKENILYVDLNPNNVLVDNNILKLIDFESAIIKNSYYLKYYTDRYIKHNERVYNRVKDKLKDIFIKIVMCN